MVNHKEEPKFQVLESQKIYIHFGSFAQKNLGTPKLLSGLCCRKEILTHQVLTEDE